MDNSTAFWSIIFPTILPFILIIMLFLLWRIVKWRKCREWKYITAHVLRIDAIEKRDSCGVLEPRRYKIDIVFQWQGTDRYRSWTFPRIYDLPKAGDILQLRYHPKKEDLQLVMSPAEKREVRHARLLFLAVLGIFVFAVPVLTGLLFYCLPHGLTLSGRSQWLLLAVTFPVIFLIVRIYRVRRLRRKIERGALWPITVQVQGFRKDSEGEVHAFCVVSFIGREKEVTLPVTVGRNYEIGQLVTVYVNPDSGEVICSR